MSWKIKFDAEVGCIFVTLHEKMTLQDFYSIHQDIYTDSQFQKGLNILFDLSLARFPDNYTFKTISKKAKNNLAEINQRLGDIKVAHVVGNNHDYKLIHQWIISRRLSTKFTERKLFREIEQAIIWLKLPEGYSNPETL